MSDLRSDLKKKLQKDPNLIIRQQLKKASVKQNILKNKLARKKWGLFILDNPIKELLLSAMKKLAK